jgi:hypothetical protein
LKGENCLCGASIRLPVTSFASQKSAQKGEKVAATASVGNAVKSGLEAMRICGQQLKTNTATIRQSSPHG